MLKAVARGADAPLSNHGYPVTIGRWPLLDIERHRCVVARGRTGPT
jgi:hypothetical protein